MQYIFYYIFLFFLDKALCLIIVYKFITDPMVKKYFTLQ